MVHLKALTLRGFKSFASTTTLRLEPGITCVVGPNGSGKSNVVDALAWVMGEQGAKSLRGGQMADVIFGGTSDRPPLGRTQVDLTIDNEDGALPIDYSEVTISRTLFRGGGSEYAINGAPARLIDIQELLSDTGMGRQMHVIVGQGQLDTVFFSSPEERRSFIEEAAGVLKHRRRKERALKKLADMDHNLVRVLDLTNELQRQLRPLARQAATAHKAGAIQARVRDARARLIADDIVQLAEKQRNQDASEHIYVQRKNHLQEEIAGYREKLSTLERESKELSPDAQEIGDRWRKLTVVYESLRATLVLGQASLQTFSTPTQRPQGEDPESLEERAQSAHDEEVNLRQAIDDGRIALDAAISRRHTAEKNDDKASQDLANLHRIIADHREKRARLSGDVLSARSRYQAAQAEENRAEKLLKAADERALHARTEFQELPQKISDASSEAAELHQKAVQQADAMRQQVNELMNEERDIRAKRAHWESRRDTLAESVQPDDATGTLFGRSTVLGGLPDFVSVETGWEDAVAAALSPLEDAAVIGRFEDAIRQLEDARSQGLGQLRMLIAPGEDYLEAPINKPEHSSAALPSTARWLADLIKTKEPLQDFMNMLVRGTVACESLEDIHDVLSLPGVSCIVTRVGDRATAHSVIGSGAPSISVLTLRAQYDNAATQARKAHEREQQITDSLAQAQLLLDEGIQHTRDALDKLRQEDAERAQAAELRARISSSLKAAEADITRCQNATAQLHEQVLHMKNLLAYAEQKVEDNQNVEPPQALDDAQLSADQAALAAKTAREEENHLRLELRTNEERLRQTQGRARSLRQGAQRAREEQQRYSRKAQQRLTNKTASEELVKQTSLAVEYAAQLLHQIELSRQKAEQQKSEISEQESEYRECIDRLSDQVNALTTQFHSDEIDRAETLLRLQQAQERGIQAIGMEPDELVKEFGPHNLVPDFSDVHASVPEDTPGGNFKFSSTEDGQADVSLMRGIAYVRSEQEVVLEEALKELERLGKINPMALEEHQALVQRYEFLTSQVQDLKKSKADLFTIIDDVDRLVDEAFSEAFADVKEEFSKIFEVLFPGGEGNLVLTDPDSPLISGIEIEARPAGKRVKRLSLLSGGERSLAALAFLIAIFKARPSPFYVMDEVEAALDDVNLSRLLAIFRDLQQTSQLIIITHQKRTMEISDALYGVTMRGGVSQVVSQRLGT